MRAERSPKKLQEALHNVERGLRIHRLGGKRNPALYAALERQRDQLEQQLKAYGVEA